MWTFSQSEPGSIEVGSMLVSMALMTHKKKQQKNNEHQGASIQIGISIILTME